MHDILSHVSGYDGSMFFSSCVSKFLGHLWTSIVLPRPTIYRLTVSAWLLYNEGIRLWLCSTHCVQRFCACQHSFARNSLSVVYFRVKEQNDEGLMMAICCRRDPAWYQHELKINASLELLWHKNLCSTAIGPKESSRAI